MIDANVCALESAASGLAMNIACGESHTLLELVDAISSLNHHPLKTVFGPPRQGDIKHSLADISRAAAEISYQPRVRFRDGLRKAFDEYRPA